MDDKSKEEILRMLDEIKEAVRDNRFANYSVSREPVFAGDGGGYVRYEAGNIIEAKFSYSIKHKEVDNHV